MQLRSREERVATVVSVAARIDHTSAGQFEKALEPLLAACSAQRAMLLDFTEVNYLSSVGLRALLLSARKAKAQQSRLVVAGIQPLVKEVMVISRFNAVIPLYDTVDEGLAALEAGA